MEEITTAAMAANAHNFITKLPQGYDTQVFFRCLNSCCIIKMKQSEEPWRPRKD